jgi:hypothetical protein
MVGEWRRKESFEIPALDECALVGAQVRRPPCPPRSWANLSLFQLYSHGNACANLHLSGQPNVILNECARQTCFGKSLLGTAAAPYVAGDYVAPGFITLPQAAGAPFWPKLYCCKRLLVPVLPY